MTTTQTAIISTPWIAAAIAVAIAAAIVAAIVAAIWLVKRLASIETRRQHNEHDALIQKWIKAQPDFNLHNSTAEPSTHDFASYWYNHELSAEIVFLRKEAGDYEMSLIIRGPHIIVTQKKKVQLDDIPAEARAQIVSGEETASFAWTPSFMASTHSHE